MVRQKPNKECRSERRPVLPGVFDSDHFSDPDYPRIVSERTTVGLHRVRELRLIGRDRSGGSGASEGSTIVDYGGKSRPAPAPGRYFGLAKAKAYLVALQAEKTARDTLIEADVSGLAKELRARPAAIHDWSRSRPAIHVLEILGSRFQTHRSL